MTRNDFFKILVQARTDLGYSQVKLAGISNVSLPTIQNIEAGKGNPSLEIFQKLSKPLGLIVRIEREAPNWDLLAACGVPLSPRNPVALTPSAEALVGQLRLACASILDQADGEDRDRKIKSIQATLWAVASAFPSFYERNFSASPKVHGFLPSKIDGPLIKLKRIVIDHLSTYL